MTERLRTQRVLDVIPSAYAISRSEIVMRLGYDDDLDRMMADLVARGFVELVADGYRRPDSDTVDARGKSR